MHDHVNNKSMIAMAIDPVPYWARIMMYMVTVPIDTCTELG